MKNIFLSVLALISTSVLGSPLGAKIDEELSQANESFSNLEISIDGEVISIVENYTSKKEAKKRADELSQIQQGITEERLKVFKNQEVLVLVEEVIDTQDDSTEGLAIGRSWFQAPEVDGCVVIRYEKDFESEVNAVKPGNVIKVNVLAINNVDLDARFISLEKSFESSLRFLPQ